MPQSAKPDKKSDKIAAFKADKPEI